MFKKLPVTSEVKKRNTSYTGYLKILIFEFTAGFIKTRIVKIIYQPPLIFCPHYETIVNIKNLYDK